MAVTIVVGGQFGSEGKGKVCAEIVRRDPKTAAVVRVGGTNSGHTAVDAYGRTLVLRQLPAGLAGGAVMAILPPGSYIDLAVLRSEINELRLPPDRLFISPMARVITEEHRRWEALSELGETIGSTQSGTGAAVVAMAARGAKNIALTGVQARDIAELRPYLRDTTHYLRTLLDKGKRVVIEGTQGFGLSLLHGGYWPNATSRDTSAAGLLSEAGLSPLDVDDITLVLRYHPIRVAGNSGPLLNETTWEQVQRKSGRVDRLIEYTTVTKKVRRIAQFDPELVRKAIEINRPTRIVLNHIDYIDPCASDGVFSAKIRDSIGDVEMAIGRRIDWFGVSPAMIIDRSDFLLADDGKAGLRQSA